VSSRPSSYEDDSHISLTKIETAIGYAPLNRRLLQKKGDPQAALSFLPKWIAV